MAVTPQDWDFAFLPDANSEKPEWERVIRQAYLVEHGVKTNKEIAALMGRTPGLVTQLFTDPVSGFGKQKIDTVIGPLRDHEHRREIVRLWEEAVASAEDAGGGPWEDRIIHDALRMLREHRPDLAMEAIWGAMPRLGGDNIRLTLIRLLLTCAFRLDRTGDAMTVASYLYQWGEHRRNGLDMAEGLAMKARAMRRSDRYPMSAIAATLADAMRVLTSAPEPPGPPGNQVATARYGIESEEIGNLLRHHELRGGQEELIRRFLPVAERRTAAAARPNQIVSAGVLEAWMRLSLGDIVAAEDRLDAAFENAGDTVNKVTDCGLMKAKILVARGETATAKRYLHRLCVVCREYRFLYIHRLAQQELTTLAHDSFGSLKTWRGLRPKADFD